MPSACLLLRNTLGAQSSFFFFRLFSSRITTTDRLPPSRFIPSILLHHTSPLHTCKWPILSVNTLCPAPYRKSAMDQCVFLTASSYVVLTLKLPCWLVNLGSYLAFLVSHKHSFRFLHKGWQHNVGIMSQNMMTSCHLICYLHISVVTAEKIFTV